MTIAKQVDYLGGTPTFQPKIVHVAEDNKAMLRADLNNESDTIRNYRKRIRQCEELGEYAMAELIREIFVQEQEHLIDLATALGIDPQGSPSIRPYGVPKKPAIVFSRERPDR